MVVCLRETDPSHGAMGKGTEREAGQARPASRTVPLTTPLRWLWHKFGVGQWVRRVEALVEELW